MDVEVYSLREEGELEEDMGMATAVHLGFAARFNLKGWVPEVTHKICLSVMN